MKMNENNTIPSSGSGSNTTNGISDDSCTVPSFPWIPRPTKRKSRLGTLARDRKRVLQVLPNIVNIQIPTKEIEFPSDSSNSLQRTDTGIGTSITTDIKSLDISNTPMAEFLDTSSNLDIRPVTHSEHTSLTNNNSTSPSKFQPYLESIINVKSTELYRMKTFENQPRENLSAKTVQPSCFQEHKKVNSDSLHKEGILTPSKSCLKKPSNNSNTPCSRLPTPRKEVRFVEPAPPPKPVQNLKFQSNPESQILPCDFIVKGKSYRVGCVLGKGGSSIVYMVFDNEANESRALKRVVLPEEDDCVKQGYLDEVETLKKLQSCDGIIKMFDHDLVFEAGEEVLYVVMEKGESDLAKIMRSLKEAGKLDAIIYYWQQMLQIVNEIHNNDVIHSDLKPANFVSVNSRLKLIDFGISSSMDGDKTSIYKDFFSGTLNYMSPEAISYVQSPTGSTGYRISKKSDVWSLGCILYNFVYGHLPFHTSKKKWEKLQDIASPNKKVEFPEKSGVPLGLQVVMRKCLEKDPKLRPSVAELLKYGRIDYVYNDNNTTT